MRCILLFFTIVLISANSFAAECESLYSALVFDEKNGNILFEKRAEERIYPASLVKVMTLYLTFDALEKNKINLSQQILISANAEDVSKVNKINSLHLKEGDFISVKEAIEGVTVKSFNEAAVALAELIAGDEWHFAKMMNQEAKKLGMNNTNFRNASGLHDVGQYTTGRDLARLVIAIEKDFPQYRHYFSLKEFVYNKVKYTTHNHVLLDYKGADGFKTGFTNAAGFNLIASAKRDGSRLNSILTGCESRKKRDDFTKKLLDQSFAILEKNENEIIVKINDSRNASKH